VRQRTFFLQEKNNIAKINQNFPDLGKIIPQYQYKTYFGQLFLTASSSKMSAILSEEEEYFVAENFLNILRV